MTKGHLLGTVCWMIYPMSFNLMQIPRKQAAMRFQARTVCLLGLGWRDKMALITSILAQLMRDV
uniref:Uncharacterized protein n=1 Tax=Rhizophora mucronata TaxID=61149 RepID=A0A2P2MZP8_RHIMU